MARLYSFLVIFSILFSFTAFAQQQELKLSGVNNWYLAGWDWPVVEVDSTQTGMAIVPTENSGDSAQIFSMRVVLGPRWRSEDSTYQYVRTGVFDRDVLPQPSYDKPRLVFVNMRVPFYENIRQLDLGFSLVLSNQGRPAKFWEILLDSNWQTLTFEYGYDQTDTTTIIGIRLAFYLLGINEGYGWIQIEVNRLVFVYNDGRIIEVDNFDHMYPTGVQQLPSSQNPEKFILHQNYPNPFNPATVIRYEVPEGSVIQLRVYDLLGREIATLINKEQSAGTYEVDFSGANLPSGIYTYALQAGSYRLQRKMLLIK
jgi:hypothetical protein